MSSRERDCHRPRCKYATPVCSQESPVQEELSPNHFVRFHHARELTLRGVARATA